MRGITDTSPAEDHIRNRHFPPGRIKITEALKSLLKEKDFNAITWAEIARTAGVNEALIYKYFREKRNLLHQVLLEYMLEFDAGMHESLRKIHGALNKLRKLIWFSLHFYDRDRVFARILLVEVRNYPGYFESETYGQVRNYSKAVLDILEEGVKNNEIRSDIPLRHMRSIILGAIEHICLPCVIFDREISPDVFAEDIFKTIFPGISKQAEARP